MITASSFSLTDTLVGFVAIPLVVISALVVFRWVAVALAIEPRLALRTLLYRTMWPLGAAVVIVLALGLPLVERGTEFIGGSEAAPCGRALGNDADRGGLDCRQAVDRRRDVLVVTVAFGLLGSTLLLVREQRLLLSGSD